MCIVGIEMEFRLQNSRAERSRFADMLLLALVRIPRRVLCAVGTKKKGRGKSPACYVPSRLVRLFPLSISLQRLSKPYQL